MRNESQIREKKSREMAVSDFPLIDEALLKSRIHMIRGVKVMLDADLAEIYGYETRKFNEQVKYNIEKFDSDFRFQLSKDEYAQLDRTALISEFRTSKRGGTRKLPYAFTEQGIYMLMTVLKGEKLYHCGASSKDAGNKITTIVQLEDIEGFRPMFEELWGRVKNEE